MNRECSKEPVSWSTNMYEALRRLDPAMPCHAHDAFVVLTKYDITSEPLHTSVFSRSTNPSCDLCVSDFDRLAALSLANPATYYILRTYLFAV